MTFQTEPQDEITRIANSLLESSGYRVKSYKILQKLWAGYGHICQIDALPSSPSNDESKVASFILKHVTPPSRSKQQSKDEGHIRKLISYQVEQHFYTILAPRMPLGINVARAIGSVNSRPRDENQTIALMLTDLRKSFPVAGEKRGSLNEKQVDAALEWLASFHGFWWTRTGEIRKKGKLRLLPLEEAERTDESKSGNDSNGVWLNGGYTYLATRRKEYDDLESDEDSEWSEKLCRPVSGRHESIAELVGQVLTPASSISDHSAIAEYETLIHGDVKPENLFASSSGNEVAFYDFQYVGLGLGVSDLAKLFTCSVPIDMLVDDHNVNSTLEMGSGEKALLKSYQNILQTVSGKMYPWDVLEMHWNTALVDWLRFQASWGFWGNTEWLEARVRHILTLEKWQAWILQAAGTK